MAVKRKRKSCLLNFLVIIIVGGLMLVASVFIFNYILRGVFGPYAFSDNILSTESVKEVFEKPVLRMAIFYSERTEKMLEEGNTYVVTNVEIWENYLKNYEFEYEIITEERFQTGESLHEYDLIILPGSKSISDEEMLALKNYIDTGGNLLATGALASYAAGGKWRGWQFFKEVFGINFAREIERDVKYQLNTLRGGLPITANIPTGFALKIATWDNPVAAEVLEPRSTQVSFWYNFREADGLVMEEIETSAGIAYGTYGSGRFVWFGFDLTSIQGEQEDFIYADRLIQNSIKWVTRQPVAFIEGWPGDYKAAAVFLPVLSDSMQNIRNAFPIFRRHNIRPTFLYDPGRMDVDTTLLRQCTNYGDFAAVVDVGYMDSITDTVNSLNDLETQKQAFIRAREQMEPILGYDIVGAIPSNGLFNDHTLMAMSQTGFKFLVTDSLTDRSEPNYVIKGEEGMMVVTKTARDDYKVIREYGLQENDFQQFTYEEDIDRIVFEGGLYVFKFHTNYQLTPSNVETLSNVIEYLKEQNIWLTSIPEMYAWWSNRKNVEMRVETRGTRRVVVALSNVGEYTISKITVPVEFQSGIEEISISTEIIGTKIPDWEYDTSSNIIYLHIEDLTPDESRIYYVDFKKTKA